jgi:hypothetical protein
LTAGPIVEFGGCFDPFHIDAVQLSGNRSGPFEIRVFTGFYSRDNHSSGDLGIAVVEQVEALTFAIAVDAGSRCGNDELVSTY